MFTHMVPIEKVTHQARGADFELLVYQVEETKEFRIYVTKDGFGVGDIYTASQEVVDDAKNLPDPDLIASLLDIAKDDIDRNEFGQF